MAEKIYILTQEVDSLKKEKTILEKRLDEEETLRKKMDEMSVRGIEQISSMITKFSNQFEEKLKQKEAEIYSSLYHFRVFRWKIEGSVGNVPSIKLTGLRTVFENDTSLYISELKLSYLDLLGNEVALPGGKSEHQIPLPNPTLFIRFSDPVKHKTWNYATHHVQNQGYTDTGNPASWLIEGSNDEKNWTLLSQGNNQTMPAHSKTRDHIISIRNYKRE